MKRIPAPLAFNIIPGAKTPPFKIEDLEARGVRYLTYHDLPLPGYKGDAGGPKGTEDNPQS